MYDRRRTNVVRRGQTCSAAVLVFTSLRQCRVPSNNAGGIPNPGTSGCIADAATASSIDFSGTRREVGTTHNAVAPVAYQVILEPGTDQFREFESPRVQTRINSWGLFLAHNLTCGKRESVG